MKKIYQLKHVYILILFIGIATSAGAQNFNLIDINKITSSNPFNYQYSQHSTLAFFQGNFYFTADDGIHGKELFKSDGTGNRTQLVKDISPGPVTSNIIDIVVSGKMLYFVVTDSINTQSIWVSDGTGAGTNPLSNTAEGALNSSISFLTDVSGTLYFSYNYYDFSGNHAELWKTDITGTAVVKVADINGYVEQMVSANGKLFYTFYDYSTSVGTELYVSDGTAAGTKLVADINPAPYASSNPTHLTALNGLLYFAADDGSGNKLWISDGTRGGTFPANNKNNVLVGIYGSSFGADPFGIKDNFLYFPGKYFDAMTATSTGYELFKYNTAAPAQSIALVKDIIPGDSSSSPTNFTNVRGTIYFNISTGFKGFQLWKSDGTNTGTVIVKDIDPGEANYFYGLNNIEGVLYFSYHNNNLGSELWKSDGTAAGTVVIKDIYPGAAGSNPDFLIRKNGVTLFSANGTEGNELWRTDGTTAGTRLVKDINTTTTSSSDPSGFTALGNKAVFRAYDGISTSNLHISDGSVHGTKSLSSVATVRSLFNTQSFFTILKKEAYFIDSDSKLWKTNGKNAGTLMLPLPAFINMDSGVVMNLVATSNLLYVITYNSPTNTSTLWRTDGSPAGTYIVKSGINSFFNLYATAVGNTLYFADIDSYAGSQLWKTDGSIAATVLVKTIGSQNYNPLSNLYSFKGKLFFNAYTSSGTGPALWTSDGTDLGTVELKDLTLVQQSFAQANGKLFFYASDNTASLGYELYTTNGTNAGTRIVKDINPGPGSSNVYLNPSSVISGNKILYFIADDGVNGAEPWKSDGTSNGTMLIKDATPGYNYGNITAAVNSHDRLFFVENYNVLWESDGTAANTNPVTDASLNGLNQVFSLTAIGNYIFFSAYTYGTGNELYVGSGVIQPGSPGMITNNLFAEKSDTDLAAIQLKLSPNPARNILQVYVNGLKQNTPATIYVISPSGNLLSIKRSDNLNHVVPLDISSLPGGAYIIKVVSADKILYKQFIKL